MSLNDRLKVAVLALDIAEGDKDTNINAVADSLGTLPAGTDLVVLPELFSTGYLCETEQAAAIAETTEGETITRLKQLAGKYKVAIAGSYLSTTDEALYNRGFIIEPSGEATYYDKRHLFCISAESHICTRGTKLPPVVRFRGWNIALAICYDLRFPAWLRNIGNRYDVLLVPANWPDKRAYAWGQLLKARAIENESYVVGANRSGEDEFGIYTDLNQIYDIMGKPVGEQTGAFMCATLDKIEVESHRRHFPVWRDADAIRFDI